MFEIIKALSIAYKESMLDFLVFVTWFSLCFTTWNGTFNSL